MKNIFDRIKSFSFRSLERSHAQEQHSEASPVRSRKRLLDEPDDEEEDVVDLTEFGLGWQEAAE